MLGMGKKLFDILCRSITTNQHMFNYWHPTFQQINLPTSVQASTLPRVLLDIAIPFIYQSRYLHVEVVTACNYCTFAQPASNS